MRVAHRQFTRAMMDPAQPVPEGLVNPDGAAATKRFDVYRNNVAVSLTEALETAFPVVRKLVGDEFFKAMAGVYLRLHPPKSPLMMFYGAEMPQFLRRFKPAKSLRYLPDIAKVELGLRAAYHAADAAPVVPQRLAEVAPDALMKTRFGFAPAVQVITSDHPIYAIYRANTGADAMPTATSGESLLICRQGFDPQLHLLTPSAAAFVGGLMADKPLGIAAALAGDDLDVGQTIGLLLQQNALTDLT